jgi:seryl-tRNA synthetase
LKLINHASGAAHYKATQIGSQINSIQKEIGLKKKVIFQQKVNLQKEKARQEEIAAEKFVNLQSKVKTIGNYVHDSVPVSDNEVYLILSYVTSMSC